MAHLHSVYDNDTHFKIDPVTRKIKNETGKVILMQNDHNSERFTFEIPRYIEGHDMSVCNKVEVHFINLKADNTEKCADVYPVEDLQVSPDSADVVICSWLISQNATKYAGSLNFVIRFACLTGNVIDYQWYTDIHKGITVSESISNTRSVVTAYSDVLEQWRQELFVGSGSAFDPTVYGLPVLYLTGDTAGMNKDNAVTLDYVYGELSGECTLKWQGSSSQAYPKKNYTIKFDNAFEAKEGWGEQKKYCLKANYIDHSHARNIVSAKLWGEIVKSRKATGGITGAIGYDGHNRSEFVTVANNSVTVRLTAYNHGAVFFEGQTFPAGQHVVTFEVYNPYSDYEGTQYAKLCFGAPGDEDVDFRLVNVNTVEAFDTWLHRSFTVDFPVDGSMIGFVMAGISEADERGYIFRNIEIDGKPYAIEPTQNELAAFPNGGAIDGFPCVIMLNGKFHGLYTFNIPKDGWMFGMGSGTHEAIVCADNPGEAPCGFKSATASFNDFSLEYAPDKNNADWILTSLNNCISAVVNSDGTDLDTTVAQYLDWQSAIDYLIFSVLIGGTDMYRKNYLLATYDGVKWFFSAYDMDSTYGMQWDGKGFDSALCYPYLNDYNHRVMELIYAYKKDELLTRYEQIRKAALSEDNVYQMFTNFAAGIPSPVLMEDVKLYPTIPSSSASNVAQILNWYRLRSAFIDKQV